MESCFYIRAPAAPQQQLYFGELFFEGATDSNAILGWCVFIEVHPEAVETFGSFKESPSSLYIHTHICKINFSILNSSSGFHCYLGRRNRAQRDKVLNAEISNKANKMILWCLSSLCSYVNARSYLSNWYFRLHPCTPIT